MNHSELERRLIAAARLDRPSDRVPYAFEQRILARIKVAPVLDDWAAWAQALWKAAAPCLAIVALLGAWSFLTPKHNPPANDVSQEFENALLASVDQDQPIDSAR